MKPHLSFLKKLKARIFFSFQLFMFNSVGYAQTYVELPNTETVYFSQYQSRLDINKNCLESITRGEESCGGTKVQLGVPNLYEYRPPGSHDLKLLAPTYLWIRKGEEHLPWPPNKVYTEGFNITSPMVTVAKTNGNNFFSPEYGDGFSVDNEVRFYFDVKAYGFINNSRLYGQSDRFYKATINNTLGTPLKIMPYSYEVLPQTP